MNYNMVAPKRKKSVKDGQGSKKPTFYAQKTVEVMDKKPVFEVFRRFGDGPETLVCKLYPDNLTNPTKFYDTDARLVYDSNSDLIHEVPGMAVNAVKQKITELYGPSPQASPPPKPATAQAKPYVPEQYKKPVAKPVGPPPKPTSPSVNYQKLYEETLNQLETTQTDMEAADSRAEELESKLAEAKKGKAGISQADLDAKLKELSEGYDDEIQNIRNFYIDFASGDCIREHKGKVEIKIYSEAKGKDFWVHQRKDGRLAYTSEEGKDVIYTPGRDLTNHFAFAATIANFKKKIKSLEGKLAKGNVADLEEKLRLSEEHCDDLIQEKMNSPSKQARRWLAAAASSAPVSMAIGYLVEKAHLIENAINNYLPSVSWLADYADKLHQADNNSGAVGGLVAGLIGMYIAYKVWMAGEKSIEVAYAKPVPVANMPKPEEIPVIQMAPPAPQPHKPATKAYRIADLKVVDGEFE
jgi:hypothetical protein